MKDDHAKFSQAVLDVQKESDLTGLTMLALKISEQIKRVEGTTE